MNHIDLMLHGEGTKPVKPEHIEKFEDLVTCVFKSPKGIELREHLEAYLRKPTWNPNEPTECAIYREGSRRFILDLLSAIKD